MGPKKNPKTPEDLLEVVVVIEEGLGSTSFGEQIIESLSKETFAEEGRVKCLIQESEIPDSIQWMTIKQIRKFIKLLLSRRHIFQRIQ